MSGENMEVVRELYAGWTVGDFAVGLGYFDPDLRFGIDDTITLTQDDA